MENKENQKLKNKNTKQDILKSKLIFY